MAACVNTDVVISGNFDSSVLYWLLVTAFRWSAGVLVALRGMEWYVSASTSHLPLRSIRRVFDHRRSAPNKGRETFAMVNSIDTLWTQTGGAQCDFSMF